MNRVFTTALTGILLPAQMLCAQTRQQLTITEATVFLAGAELLSTAPLKLVKGENEILFTNVAGNIKSQSISISVGNGVVVQSATFQNNYLTEEASSAKAADIADSITQLGESKADIDLQIRVIDEEITMLTENRKINGENTSLSAVELEKMLNLTTARWEACLTRRKKLETLRRKIDERTGALGRQLNEEQQKGRQPGGQLLVKFFAKEATTANATITYVTPNAGWLPVYDIWAGGTTGNINLFYKASISQNTGVKWNNVRVTLSTGDPNETAQAPVISPWQIAIYVPQPAGVLVNHNQKTTIVSRDELKVMPSSNVSDVAGTGTGVYQQRRGSDLSFGGARSGSTEYIVDGVVVRNGDNTTAQGTINNYVAVDNSGVSTTFDIELPYTIPSDGQQHLVAIKEYMLPAAYRYFAVPRLDKDVFLIAQVTKWEDLNLLPGETHIYHDGTYVGQGTLDVRNLKDTLNISLGRDKKIIVKREQDTKRHTRTVVGANEHEALGYNISIRNTRKESIDLVLLDQLPVSIDNVVEVKDVETSDAQADEKTGILTWNLHVTSSETKNIGFSFSVKYPKGRTVAGMR